MYVTTLDLGKLVTSWPNRLHDKQILNRNGHWQPDAKASWLSLAPSQFQLQVFSRKNRSLIYSTFCRSQGCGNNSLLMGFPLILVATGP